jgi:hypothetical protein
MIDHFVFPAKCRRAEFDEERDFVLKEMRRDIEKKYEIKFIEIGVDTDHAPFSVQSVPTYQVTK